MHKFIFIITGVLILSHISSGQDRITGRTFATRSEVLARHGMACTSQPLATQAALDILKQGGTAIDAAIAADALLGLVEPTGSGMGGDLFAIVWDAKTQKLYGLNGSGRSPRSLTLDYFHKKGYDIASMGFGSSDYIHYFVEAKKLAFADRAKFYADPDFNKILILINYSQAIILPVVWV